MKREYASDNDTELNVILSKMIPLNPKYLSRKQSIFQKIAEFVEEFKGVGGQYRDGEISRGHSDPPANRAISYLAGGMVS